MRPLQMGLVQFYALAMVLGMLILSLLAGRGLAGPALTVGPLNSNDSASNYS